jgi:hypothetical protein
MNNLLANARQTLREREHSWFTIARKAGRTNMTSGKEATLGPLLCGPQSVTQY